MLGKSKQEKQSEMFITWQDMPEAPGHPFYQRLNQLLDRHQLDRYCEEACREFYAEKMGRPGLAPGVYFRCLLIGYFEGIDSERGIAWRAKDSLSLRKFLRIELSENVPDHSTISRTRRLIDIETHQQVFQHIVSLLNEEGLIDGKTLGVDSTTLEGNAAMRSIVRRDTAESYQQFLERLAKESGIETPTREELARMDRKRKKTASNKDWMNPHDPDAAIMKMKDGSTHMGYKAEHGVDMQTGAIVSATIQRGDRGDTECVMTTVQEAIETLSSVLPKDTQPVQELVADKGYHSGPVLVTCEKANIRTYISEPKRGRRKWVGKSDEQKATYRNRARSKLSKSKRLHRKRGELVERTFAHCLETGGMRRIHLRGLGNIAKRYLIHVSAFNLSLVMRKLYGVGTPRGWKKRVKKAFNEIISILKWHFLLSNWGKAVIPIDSFYTKKRFLSITQFSKLCGASQF